MLRENILDLLAFRAVAEERSFTKAAAKLGVSQSGLSHTIRNLEARLGVRLLARTTRSVAVTEAGDRLLGTMATRLDDIETELGVLTAQQGKPAGAIRITASGHAADAVLWPRLPAFLADHPAISVEIVVEYGLSDIVAERYDAGVRFGEQVAKDMIAVRIGPDISMAVVGSPTYFKHHKKPVAPQDLVEHNCVNLRFPSSGGIYVWEFEKDGHELRVRVEGQFIVNSSALQLKAALEGVGLCNVPIDMARDHIAAGRLVQVLGDWSPPFTGYHLYFPSRRQETPAFALLLDTLRLRS
jgi:DNA-binding transcriptional LysR family regulator